MSADGQGTKCHRNIAENYNRLVGCTSVTDDRQTAGDSNNTERERSRSPKI